MKKLCLVVLLSATVAQGADVFRVGARLCQGAAIATATLPVIPTQLVSGAEVAIPLTLFPVGVSYLVIANDLRDRFIDKLDELEDFEGHLLFDDGHGPRKAKRVYRLSSATRLSWWLPSWKKFVLGTEHGKIAIGDVIGKQIVDHQDVGRYVQLLTTPEDVDYVYRLGQVVEVFDNGLYEIRIDGLSHPLTETSSEIVDIKPVTALIQRDQQLQDGGFEFRNPVREVVRGRMAATLLVKPTETFARATVRRQPTTEQRLLIRRAVMEEELGRSFPNLDRARTECRYSQVKSLVAS